MINQNNLVISNRTKVKKLESRQKKREREAEKAAKAAEKARKKAQKVGEWKIKFVDDCCVQIRFWRKIVSSFKGLLINIT